MAISLKQDGGLRPKLFTASRWKARQKTDEMKFHRCLLHRRGRIHRSNKANTHEQKTAPIFFDALLEKPLMTVAGALTKKGQKQTKLRRVSRFRMAGEAVSTLISNSFRFCF